MSQWKSEWKSEWVSELSQCLLLFIIYHSLLHPTLLCQRERRIFITLSLPTIALLTACSFPICFTQYLKLYARLTFSEIREIKLQFFREIFKIFLIKNYPYRELFSLKRNLCALRFPKNYAFISSYELFISTYF